jgi:hypothetical protein
VQAIDHTLDQARSGSTVIARGVPAIPGDAVHGIMVDMRDTAWR